MTDAPFPKFPKPVLGPDFQARMHKAMQAMSEALRRYRERPHVREGMAAQRLRQHIRDERAKGLLTVRAMGVQARMDLDAQPHLLDLFVRSVK